MRAFLLSSLLLLGCGSETFVDAPRDAGPGGADGSSGDAGNGGDAGDAQSLTDGAPSGTCPPDMVRASTGCIDAREVTYGQYNAFVAATTVPTPAPLELPLACRSLLPQEYAPFPDHTADRPDHPVANVTWCGAYAYCLHANKRLCGALGGGGAMAGGAPLATSEWYDACSLGGQREVPYPWTSKELGQDGTCVVNTIEALSVNRPGNKCEGAYPGLFDMVGNVEEWIDRCDGDGREANCHALGAAYDDALELTDSHCGSIFVIGREERRESIGFRCCK